MKKRTSRKLKNKIHDGILKLITGIASAVLFVSICCIDSEDPTIFYISSAISGAWIILFCIANNKFD